MLSIDIIAKNMLKRHHLRHNTANKGALNSIFFIFSKKWLPI
jgi:hypothetical protein